MDQIHALLRQYHADNLVRAILLVAIGYVISRLLSASIHRSLKARLRKHQLMLLRRTVFFLVFALFLASAIQQMGFRISALLGATGILTLAFGIASQTSMSNLVSGIFIIGEKPFEIGDTINLNGITGEIISIGFMSVRLRTNENTMIRVPNETLIKSSIINLSHYPERCLLIPIGIGYTANIHAVKQLLLDLMNTHPLCLKEPAPLILFDNFGDSTVNLQLQVWVKKEDAKQAKSQLQTDIKELFDAHNIEIPFPCRSLYIEKSAPFTLSTSTVSTE